VAVLQPAAPARLARPVVSARDRRLNFGDRWEYAPAPETTPVKIKPRYELFINGKFCAPRAGKYFDSINPATEEKLCEIAHGGAEDVDRAVKAARRAYETVWSKMPGRERGKYLFRVARIVQERARELAILETMDGGKPIKESRDFDVPTVAAHFFYHGGWADKLAYAFPGRKPRPLGVAGQIVPWNFPLLMAAWKIAPALACGNTVVPPCSWPKYSRKPACPTAWSTSSRERRRRAGPFTSIRMSTRLRSPVRRKWARSSRAPAPGRQNG
jgi:aldehyde dehydrogenase (NAD+)